MAAVQYAPGLSTVVLFPVVPGFRGPNNWHVLLGRLSAAQVNQPVCEYGHASAVVATFSMSASRAAVAVLGFAGRLQRPLGSRRSAHASAATLRRLRARGRARAVASAHSQRCAGRLAVDAALGGLAAGVRADEVARQAFALMYRSAPNFGGGNILPRPTVTAFQHFTPTAAQLAAHGVPGPPMGETYTIILAIIPFAAPLRNMLGRCVLLRRARTQALHLPVGNISLVR